MLEKLGSAIKKATDKIANSIFLDKNLVDSIIRDLQRALIEADIDIQLVKEISNYLREEAFSSRIKEIEKKEHLIKILYEKLTSIIGEKKELEISPQTKIMLIGLYGSGKTTTIAKLANFYSKRGKKVALVGLDVHRPAARDQIEQLAKKNNLTAFVDYLEKDPIKSWKKIEPKLKSFDLILIDTAGRHTLDKDLIKEIKDLNKSINPKEKLLVIPADIGQSAKKQSTEFQEALKITGVIITRMDSSAKGGGALTACAQTNSPVLFIGTGEKISDIEVFNPKSFLSRILGMGDLESLIEKIKSVTEKSSQKGIEERIKKGNLTLLDVVEQIKSMNQIGGFQKMKSLIPGLSNAPIKDEVLENQEKKISKWEHILKSMNPKEIENPEILEKEHTRISRISKGAGVNNSDVKSLLKQYKMLKEMITLNQTPLESDTLNQKQIEKLMKKFGKKKIMRLK